MKWQLYLAAAVVVVAFFIYKQLRSRLGEQDAVAVRQALASGARIVDVRTPAEFSAGHVPGAVNIPLSELTNNLKKVGKKRKPVVVYCRSGSRSAHAANILRQRGFAQVLDMKAMTNWQRVQVLATAQ